jgi:hypothetical protein
MKFNYLRSATYPMKMMQKDCLIRHLVREMWLEIISVKPFFQNLAILEILIGCENIWRVQEVIITCLPAPFVCMSQERDL